MIGNSAPIIHECWDTNKERGVSAMPGGINCQIEECHHNDGAGMCRANNIEVRSSVVDKKCNMSENTCCETFKPKLS